MSIHSSRVNVLLIALLVALAACGAYGLTLTPGVGLVDSGELALAAWLPGNAHPPGTPLYVMLGWLFTRLPLGTVAVRLNVLSAVCGAVAAALIAVAAWLMRPARVEPAWRAYLAPLAAGLSFAFSTSLWTYAVVAEVYTLHIALLAGILVALYAWRREPGALGERSNRWLFVAAFLAGLAFTVHNASVLTLVPAILFLVIGRDWEALRSGRTRTRKGERGAGSKGQGAGSGARRAARREHGAGGEVRAGASGQHPASGRAAEPALNAVKGRRGGPRAARPAFVRVALIAAGCVAAGLLAYAYLPLRAAGKPLLNWGDPSTPLAFWWHITGKWYQLFFETAQTSVPERLVRFFAVLAQQQFYFGLLAVALGLWSLWRRDRTQLVFLLLIVLGNLVLFAWYDTYQDQQAYVYPALLSLGLLIGEAPRLTSLPQPPLPSPGGSVTPAKRVRPMPPGEGRRGLGAWGAAALALAVPLVALAGNYAANDHSRDWLAEDYARNVLRGIEPGGVLLSSEWDATISPLMYVQRVLGERPDVTVIDVNLMRRSWYADYVRQADPTLYTAVAPQYDAFLRNLKAWEIDECKTPPCAAEIQPNFEALVDAMVSQSAAAGRPVYLTRDVDASVTRDPQKTWMVVSPGMTRVPQGLAYRLYADTAFHPTPAPVLALRGLSDGTVPLPPTAFAAEVPGRYVDMLTVRAHYLQGGGDTAGATEVFRQLLRVDPDNAEAQAAVGQ